MRFGILTLALVILTGTSPAANIPPSDTTVLTGLLYQHIERYTGFIDTSPDIPITLNIRNASAATVRGLLESWITSRGAVIDRSGGTDTYHLSVTIPETVIVIQRSGDMAQRTTKLTVSSTLMDPGGSIFDGATTTESYTDEFDPAFIPATDDGGRFMPGVLRRETDRWNPRMTVTSLFVILGMLTYFAVAH